MNDELKELRRRFALLRDEELLKILTARRAQYRQAALDAAAEELTRRGVAFTPPAGTFTPHAHVPAAAPAAPKPKGWEYWLGIVIIGGLCLLAAETVDYLSSADDVRDDGSGGWYVKLGYVLLISVLGGRLMQWWESVD